MYHKASLESSQANIFSDWVRVLPIGLTSGALLTYTSEMATEMATAPG